MDQRWYYETDPVEYGKYLIWYYEKAQRWYFEKDQRW